ncbi:GNAT family N-acetyltransferase [Mycolicibacterium moriokaense]|uniref:N-acetyltransferase n=1 Tax=Mycolicibacterium moriokaense TaxID=39691 RepID=A0AAD1HDK8_9MYCO|nr:GNAT family N-acetyltransferase [Mycolicibacterium moriokaense]MCV7038139.1 GNAT family N-acetyltransferase [Mycolicibacterium moriokaense]ORB19262.1 GNAT family N-acetyltransferase [Mycolicibacterium moriokaense]BBX03029.1 N-acetyltransferase [Mycolicibacterium moriokaense]
MQIDVTAAVVDDVPELADVAARTFPLACPPSVTSDNIAAFIAENLSEERFRDYLADDERFVLAGREDGRMVGYAMLIRGVPDDDDVQRAVTLRPAIEVSKLYVLPDSHGAGVSAALMNAALDWARDQNARAVWLGVNQQNRRAQRFYGKHGFTISGTKAFRLGAGVENDYVMVRPL